MLMGKLTVSLNSAANLLQPGDQLQIPANQAYAFWNDSEQPAVINCRMRPALNAEYMLEQRAVVAKADAATSRAYRLGGVLLARQFSNLYRRTNLPYIVQKLVFMLLSPIAYLMSQVQACPVRPDEPRHPRRVGYPAPASVSMAVNPARFFRHG